MFFKIQRSYDPQNPLFHEQLLRLLYANNASCIQLFGYTWERCFLCDTGSLEEQSKYSQRELSLWPGYYDTELKETRGS